MRRHDGNEEHPNVSDDQVRASHVSTENAKEIAGARKKSEEIRRGASYPQTYMEGSR